MKRSLEDMVVGFLTVLVLMVVLALLVLGGYALVALYWHLRGVTSSL